MLDLKREEILGLVNAEEGLIDRRIYSDADIYQLELENIFARAWNFMAHDSQIPNPGDFFLNFIGEDRVIVVRDRDGQPQVLINSCRHRGNAVCRADEGRATSFMCSYHGWTYDLKGRLVGIPGFKEVYHEEIDRENWGLVKAAQVASYKGFIFATMDANAPPLYDYLGEVGRLGIDYFSVKDELQAVSGVQKWVLDCNWKFAVDNVWDWYHVSITHASSAMAGGAQRGRPAPRYNLNHPELVVLGEYGHAIGGDAVATEQERTQGRAAPDTVEARQALGNVGMKINGYPGLFPNLWLQAGTWCAILRLPKGPMKSEMWRIGFVGKNMSPEEKRQRTMAFIRGQGPAGMTEQDDAENWIQSTSGTTGAIIKRYPLHYAMDIGHGEIIDDEQGPPRIESPNRSEHAQLWYYRNWSEWLAARNWKDLAANHSPVPSGYV